MARPTPNRRPPDQTIPENAPRLTPMKSRLLAWCKNAGLQWNFNDPEHVLAKRLMDSRLDVWREFVDSFKVGFDPNENKFFNLNNPDEFRAWAQLVFDRKIPHGDPSP